MRKKKFWLLLFSIFMIALSIFSLTACMGDDMLYLGTYKGGRDTFIITKKYVNINGENYTYTIVDDKIRVENFKVDLNFHNNYQVLSFDLLAEFDSGSITERNQYFNATLYNYGNGGILEFYTFKRDGTVLYVNASDTTKNKSATYRIKDGVIEISFKEIVTFKTGKTYWYVTENGQIYYDVYIKDVDTYFDNNNGNSSSDHSSVNTGNGNTSSDHSSVNTENENNSTETPTVEVCKSLHKDLKIGVICSDCNKECYAKTGEDVLMYNSQTGELFAEIYGKQATENLRSYSADITNVFISKEVETIDLCAFRGFNKLKSVAFEPEGCLRNIGESAFQSCNSLTSIVLPNSVVSIEDEAFYGCYNLINIEIGENIKNFGRQCFFETKWWQSQKEDSVVYLGNVCVGVKGTLSINTSINIKDGTVTIADYAFYSQGGLRTINFPESLKNIGGCAFVDCLALVNVNSGGNVEYVEVITDDLSMKSEECTPFSNTQYYQTAFVDGIFYFDKVLLKANDSINAMCIINEGIKYIAEFAFNDGYMIKILVIPKSLVDIGNYAFSIDWMNVTNIYYKGTESDWEAVNLDFDYNYKLESATLYYYSETQPTSTGNYWYYDANGEIAIW